MEQQTGSKLGKEYVYCYICMYIELLYVMYIEYVYWERLYIVTVLN